MKPVKTFIIRHKLTGAIVTVPSGKTSWKAVGHAKNAWNTFSNFSNQNIIASYADKLGIELTQSTNYWSKVLDGIFRFPRFDEQDIYEIVELKPESETILGTASALLTECLGRITDSELEKRVREFLNKQESEVE